MISAAADHAAERFEQPGDPQFPAGCETFFQDVFVARSADTDFRSRPAAGRSEWRRTAGSAVWRDLPSAVIRTTRQRRIRAWSGERFPAARIDRAGSRDTAAAPLTGIHQFLRLSENVCGRSIPRGGSPAENSSGTARS